MKANFNPRWADNTLYREVTGSFNYLMICISPDMSSAISKMFQFKQDPTVNTTRQWILKYVLSTSTSPLDTVDRNHSKLTAIQMPIGDLTLSRVVLQAENSWNGQELNLDPTEVGFRCSFKHSLSNSIFQGFCIWFYLIFSQLIDLIDLINLMHRD